MVARSRLNVTLQYTIWLVKTYLYDLQASKRKFTSHKRGRGSANEDVLMPPFMPQKVEFPNRKPVWEVAAAAVVVVIYGPGTEWLKTGHGSTAVYSAVLTALLRCEIESGLSDDLACRMPMCDGPATCGPDGHRFLTNYKIPQANPSEPPSR